MVVFYIASGLKENGFPCFRIEKVIIIETDIHIYLITGMQIHTFFSKYFEDHVSNFDVVDDLSSQRFQYVDNGFDRIFVQWFWGQFDMLRTNSKLQFLADEFFKFFCSFLFLF